MTYLDNNFCQDSTLSPFQYFTYSLALFQAFYQNDANVNRISYWYYYVIYYINCYKFSYFFGILLKQLQEKMGISE